MKQINSQRWNLVFVLFILLGVGRSYAQTFNYSPILTTKQHIVNSSFNHKSYRLNILLPKSYLTSDTVHYPTLYVLDGRYNFMSFFSIKEVLDLGAEVKDVIIVGIDTDLPDADWMASRFYDFTPSHNAEQDSLWTKIFHLAPGKLVSGGAPLFLNTLEKDIIPYVENHYKTNGNRGLFGHSLGGMFAAYTLLSKPGMFQNYSINSPSFWWNNGELMTLESSFIKQNLKLSSRIFISVGSLEGTPMVTPMTLFTDTLKTHYPGLKINSQIFDNETHLSVVSAASSRTLKVLYSH